ncbi:MAG TPA: hypothetical protein VMZ91_13955 [Candidatus Paceibacterota bacterium]|nr:hypothetical protein [Candidatus Paceibacterota bacterium]
MGIKTQEEYDKIESRWMNKGITICAILFGIDILISFIISKVKTFEDGLIFLSVGTIPILFVIAIYFGYGGMDFNNKYGYKEDYPEETESVEVQKR